MSIELDSNKKITKSTTSKVKRKRPVVDTTVDLKHAYQKAVDSTAVDKELVNKLRAKLQQGKLDILHPNPEIAEAAALKLADKILKSNKEF